jgi:23S rRNA (uracil1939-C5)-methyltransferase
LRRGAAKAATHHEGTVVALGHLGDGLVRLDDGGEAHVAGVLPDERVRVALGGDDGARLLEVITGSPKRAAPACRHFGICGGCVAQHLDDETYRDWRRGQIVSALAQRGFQAPPVEPTVAVAAGTRRRATFAWRRKRDRVTLGFRVRAGHDVVALETCPVLHPDFVVLLPHLRGLATALDANGRLDVTRCDNGFNVIIEQRNEPDVSARLRMADFAAAHGVARMSWRAGQGSEAEPVIQTRAPRIAFAGIDVAIPPCAFLQPTPEGETHLQHLVGEMAGGAARIADLFAGCGTLALPLARQAHVTAIDLDGPAIRALQSAAGAAGHAGARVRLDAAVRDLFRRPLQDAELKGFEAVVFDPPRAGAAAQAAALAASRVERIVAVSCNPATFARDARTLCDGGYVLRRALPIDQFVWSHHVEVVALFTR